jgi:uncharacterized protein (TIGR02302 family)
MLWDEHLRMTPNPVPAPPLRGLGRMRRMAGAVLWFERIWPAIAPALGLLAALVCIALLNVPRLLPPLVHLGVLAVAAIAFVLLLVFGLRRVRKPLPAEADRRLEQDSGLRHQPLAVLADRPAGGGGAVWAAHVARAQAQLGRLKLRAPRPMLAALDARALRALVLVGLAASIVIAGNDAGARLLAALHPGFAVPVPPPPALVQAWITPPLYTGLPPVFLKPEGGDASVPSGSKLTINVSGGNTAGGAPALEEGGHSTALAALDANSFQIDATLTRGGHVAVRRGTAEMAGWNLVVVADVPPEVSFPERPGSQAAGATPQTRLPWQASHAYGVTELHAELHLAARPNAAPLLVPIPLPGAATKSAKGSRIIDLTANPWAGLPVNAQLVAHDAPGLEGRSEILQFRLPERRFNNLLARAVAVIRRQLSVAPEDHAAAIAGLDQLAGIAGAWDDDGAGYLNLRAVQALLAFTQGETGVAEAQARLWSLALHLEEGAPDRTARALEAARQQLRDALEAEKQADRQNSAKENPDARTALEQRIEALQEALQKRLEALVDQARRDPDGDSYNPDAHPMDQRDMQRLTEEMKDATRKGDTDTARDKLAELEKMMQALKDSHADQGQMTERQRERAEKRQRGQQQVTVVQDMVRREGGLLDHAQGRIERRAGLRPLPSEEAKEADADAPAAPNQPDPSVADQRIQLALRRAVGEVMQQYGDLTGKVPPNLGDADTAMRQAAQAFASNQDAQAMQSVQKAIEALQKGSKSMQQQMQQQFGQGQQSGEDQADDGDDGDGEGAMAGNEPGEGQGDEGDGPGDGQGNGRGDNRGNGRTGKPGQGRQHAGQGRDRDPFGRSRGEGSAGRDVGGDVRVPEEMEQARTRELQDELRRRGADRSRSQDELDYIDRLLKQF